MGKYDISCTWLHIHVDIFQPTFLKLQELTVIFFKDEGHLC